MASVHRLRRISGRTPPFDIEDEDDGRSWVVIGHLAVGFSGLVVGVLLGSTPRVAGWVVDAVLAVFP